MQTPTLAEKTEVAPTAAHRRSDQDLQLVRRLDWRFLLPEPHLRRVGYLGPERGALPEALARFSESYNRISRSIEEKSKFDLLVLSAQPRASVEQTHALLASPGLLYWELNPLRWPAFFRGTNGRGYSPAQEKKNRWRRVAALLHDHVATLESLGFGEIASHWHRPNFEKCLEIIPVDDLALDYVFSRARTDLAGRLKLLVGRCLMQTGLMAHVAPCFSLLARKK